MSNAKRKLHELQVVLKKTNDDIGIPLKKLYGIQPGELFSEPSKDVVDFVWIQKNVIQDVRRKFFSQLFFF